MRDSKILHMLLSLPRSVPILLKKIWVYTKRMIDIISNQLLLMVSKVNVIMCGKYYSIENLPKLRFEKIKESENLNLLVKTKRKLKGNYDFLINDWIKIIVENAKDTECNLNTLQFSKLKQLEFLQIKINALKTALILYLYEYDGYKELCKKVGYNFINENKLERYIKSRTFDYNRLESELSSLIKENKKYNFYDEVSVLMKQYPSFDLEKCTVKMWNSLVKNINKGNKENE